MAGRDGVAQHHVHGEGDEDSDLAGREEGGKVGGSQHGALHQVDDLLPTVGNREGQHRVSSTTV